MSQAAAHSGPQPTARSRADSIPAWVTDEMIQRTLTLWQPYYKFTLTTDDAVCILLRVGMLIDVLSGR